MASSRVYLSTVDRVLNYTPVLPTSFLPRVCAKIDGETDTSLVTVNIDTKVEVNIDVRLCDFGKQKLVDLGLLPNADGSPTDWVNQSIYPTHWQALIDEADGYIGNTFLNAEDRIGFTLPARPISVLNKLILNVMARTFQRVPSYIPAKLYINGVFIEMQVAANITWPSSPPAWGYYTFDDLNIGGPINTVEIGFLVGIDGPANWQNVFAANLDYYYS
jgi:hypothetical protein